MSHRLGVMFILLVISACTEQTSALRASSTPTAPSTPIFRVITVEEGQIIALGEPLDDAVKAMFMPSETNDLSLRKGAFRGADTITVKLTAQGYVKAIIFTYPSGTKYTNKVEGYRRMLGQPLQDDVAHGDGARATRWQDAKTLFEVEEQGSGVSAVMYDRRFTPSNPPSEIRLW